MSKEKANSGVHPEINQKQDFVLLSPFYFIQAMHILVGATQIQDGSSVFSNALQSHSDLC